MPGAREGPPAPRTSKPADDVARLKAAEAKARVSQKYLKTLTATVTAFLDEMDVVMQGPSTFERGRKISDLCNRLNYANDCARHFGLGVPLGKLHPKGKGD